jgi:hypothetical protein
MITLSLAVKIASSLFQILFIRMEFAEAAGSNFVNHLPYSHVPYFSKKS